ncbi:MAG: GTPase ObgE [Chloroflexota bacterium]
MIDLTLIHVKAGEGGAGVVAFRREKFVPRGGPAGGDGGRGGSVILQADASLTTLQKFQYRQKFRAEDGAPGGNHNKHGASGEDSVIETPVGTEVWEVAQTQEGEMSRLLGDLSEHGQKLVVARGGRGGAGNVRFAGPSNQEPLLAEAGDPGEEKTLRLELKLLADVGIVGMPNAGKSSLLTALTGAHPKVAEYPFTTLEPMLGVIRRRLDALVLVEIPGLIEGASEGVGLGHEFLKHVERTRVLVHLVDGSELDVARRIRLINRELAEFDPRLASKPQIVAINKSDTPGFDDLKDEMMHEAKTAVGESAPVHFVSAATYDGLDDLTEALFRAVAEEPDPVEPSDTEELPVIRPRPARGGPGVIREEDGYRILNERAVRVARGSDLGKWEAQVQFHRLLERLSVAEELVEQGVQPGDTVYIADYEMEWA